MSWSPESDIEPRSERGKRTRRVGPGATKSCELQAAMWSFASGDDVQFANVYRLAAPHVYRMLLRMCREPSLAEDLTQDTFMRMYRARDAYRRGADVLPWAFTIGRRLLADVMRHRRYEVTAPDGAPDEHAVPESGDLPAPLDEQISAREMALAVEQALASLPPRQAEAFRMIKGQGLSMAEAAERTGETSLAIRLRMHRATQTIRRLFAERWEIHQSPGAAEGPSRMAPSVAPAAPI